MANSVTFDIRGLRRLERDIRRLQRLPQTAVNRAARMGAGVAYRWAKKNAPIDLGNMRKGLVMKAEKRTKLGKKMYFISYNKNMNDIFVKQYGPNGAKRAYYPASQEWGFTVMGHYTPGYRTLRKSIDENADGIRQEVLKSLRKDVDKALGGN